MGSTKSKVSNYDPEAKLTEVRIMGKSYFPNKRQSSLNPLDPNNPLAFLRETDKITGMRVA